MPDSSARIHLCPGSHGISLNHHSVLAFCPNCSRSLKVLKNGLLPIHKRPMQVHKPYDDDGVTYCGWWGDVGIIDGCGQMWPCAHTRGDA